MNRYAIALYDNESESDEELSFCRNDLFQVLEIDFMAMQGWWLCKLIKTNKTGLAPGNRLKITNDEKFIFKIISLQLNKSNLISKNSSNSISSASTSNSQSSLDQHVFKEKDGTLTRPEINKITLPAKIKTNPKNLSFNTSTGSSDCSSQKKSDEDDYDYDIPANNRPTSRLIKELDESRKSISPTIDSGISTSSLISLNSEHLISLVETASRCSINQRISDYSNYDEPKTRHDLKLDFDEKIDRICHLITNMENFSSNQILINDNSKCLKPILSEFINNNLKLIKQEYACFHPDLNTFNNLKKLIDQIEEFNGFIEKMDTEDPKNEIVSFKKNLNELKDLINEEKIFFFDRETSPNQIQHENDANFDSKEDQFYNEDDYCEIDELEEEKCMKLKRENLDKLVEKVSNTSALCMTLKRNDEKIKREIKLATSLNECEVSRLNMSDQMLLKFYLKHVEENFSDLKVIYEALREKIHKQMALEVELANKLALNGHKLIFICDTLQQNLHNEVLKINLYHLSSNMCSSLKNYVIKIKSFDHKVTDVQLQMLQESMKNVYVSAESFNKQILKSFYSY
ncbi:breast cancer anti-estrogen resistance 1 isoform X2 [Brachionus plicatilis]|uniref:Breast cancer anti-estrogen resistance 1 isoform X2 n=1 Tax=Brachionus plicatilis TaxID=10195 RepID=A0A3M7SI67_BRAPC|nr:breast cancer anti-estrogen resistance 1 isoform X2 [Brachionus plicatilis]